MPESRQTTCPGCGAALILSAVTPRPWRYEPAPEATDAVKFVAAGLDEEQAAILTESGAQMPAGFPE